MKNIFTILFCTCLLLWACADEKPQDSEPSAEKMSLKVDATDEVETEEENASSASSDINEETEENDETSEGFSKADIKTRSAETTINIKDEPLDVRVEASNDGWADMVIEEETYYFGTVEEGDIVKHTFKLKNIGTGDLIISEATASCGCTRPDYPFLPIGPQETGEINVSFNSKGRVGMQRKSVKIFSNSSPKVKLVYIEGKVVKKGELSTPPAEIQADTTSSQE